MRRLVRRQVASRRANHHVAYRKALPWLGHSSSQMPDLYDHLHDEDRQHAMMALAESASIGPGSEQEDPPFEGGETVKNREAATSR